MERFADRVTGSGLIRRSVFIVLQSYESGGNISETLDAIAQNAARIKEAEQEKKSVLMQQVYIIYAIYFLFLIIVLALFVLLNSFILQFSGGGLFIEGEVTNFCQTALARPVCSLCPVFGLGDAGAKICYYKGLFLLMIVIGGIFNGLVAGEIVEGKVSAGVKHSLIMAPFGLIIYIVSITAIIPLFTG